MLFHTLAFVVKCTFEKAPSMIRQWYDGTGENRNFEYKATMQMLKLNLHTKTIEINISSCSFITSNDSSAQTLSVCFVMPTSKHNYQCFLILVQSFSASTFSRIVDCFQYKLSSVKSYIFLFKWRRQEVKTKQQPTSRQRTRLFLARCHKDFALIG